MINIDNINVDISNIKFGNLYKVPKDYILCVFTHLPKPITNNENFLITSNWKNRNLGIRFLQNSNFIMIIGKNKSEQTSDLYYKILTSQGLFWIHSFDLSRI